MKKALMIILGLGLVTSGFAETYTVYEKPDTSSKKVARVDNNSPKYEAIFVKNSWVEIVDKTTGQVGWIEQGTAAEKASKQGMVDKVFARFQERQQKMQQHFQKMMDSIDADADISTNIPSSGSTAKTQVSEKSSSITINSNGKTAKVIKTTNNNGSVKTVEKEVPADKLDDLKL
ncbi:hypothetical protein FLM55_03615 [Francisella sp. Scap27]|uniref:hypothetical protein n=1 Tax=Francisella sp. Scap27 TaxID=2589986 RepID=UPI0015B7C43D|nr:hypothetical protein [Francisella sp. Scap27]QLE78875.1 hypothetical protein FLM55_03615 [Francisella sp. Scap27]